MAAKMNPEDLPAKLRKQLRIPRAGAFSKEHVRRHALRCLATLAELTQDQRRRVLEHAARLNKI